MDAMAITETDRTTTARARAASWRAPVIVFAVSAMVYSTTYGRSFLSADVLTANFASWHLVTSGNPWVDGISFPLFDHNPLRGEWFLEANGHTVIGRSPGVVAAGVPAYLLSRSAAFTTAPGAMTAALLTSATVTLMFLTLRRSMPMRHAGLAAAVFGFTTPVWSVAANEIWPHTITILGIAGMAWATTKHRWLLVGVFGGITLWGRLHAAVIVAVLGLFLAWRRKQPRIAVSVACTSLGFLALMSVWTRWMYGTWDPTASYDTTPFEKYDHFDVVNQLGLWVSPGRGILVFTPIILVLFAALVRSWRVLPDWTRGLMYGGLLYTLLQGALNRYSGGDQFYGYRLTLELLTCATPALALSARRMGRVAKRLFGPVLALQFLTIALGATIDGGFVDTQHAWTKNSFIVVVDRVGPLGWITVVLCLVMGVLGQRIWLRTST